MKRMGIKDQGSVTGENPHTRSKAKMNSSAKTSQKGITATIILVPYIIGILISPKVFNHPFVNALTSTNTNTNDDVEHFTDVQLWERVMKGTGVQSNTNEESMMDIFESNMSISIHRNGEADSCSTSTISSQRLVTSMAKAFPDSNKKALENHNDMSTHLFESILTTTLAFAYADSDGLKQLLPSDQCGPESPPSDVKTTRHKSWGRPNGEKYKVHPKVPSAFLSYCDMGPTHTPILPDHDDLVKVSFPTSATTTAKSLPCHFHTREGLRIQSLEDLVTYSKSVRQQQNNCADDDDANTEDQVCSSNARDDSNNIVMQIYAVPAGRNFMFAPSYIGEVFHLPHVPTASNKPVSLKVLSLRPRVFDVINFFSKDESSNIVAKALAETSDSHKIKRSSTGASGYNVNSQRTSENGFDTHGATAMAVKKRSFDVLGFSEYHESFADGLQVLRYNKTTAYIPHMDWIDDLGHREPHDYFSEKVGTNRFATILLYMSDLEGENPGGETVFTKGWPTDVAETDRISREQSLRMLRKSGDVDFLEKGSWEEGMVADCRSKLAIKPSAARAVLFYSQHPNGEQDLASLHGGCPVLSGIKWAANLWVWNGPRVGYAGSPKNSKVAEKEDAAPPGQLSATFKNIGNDPAFAEAELYFEETLWGEFSHGSPPLSVNTYEGHHWNVHRKSDGKKIKEWYITKEKKQTYTV